ncbi:MAG: hypothetical protein K8F92_16025 [Hyphomicrobium sp.]|nr:MAG: hypothetical protein F9K20_13830 [Hyphomicrobium sp.]MBZ0211139.1 hypothetical protein [Hyphomicrobium sp.]
MPLTRATAWLASTIVPTAVAAQGAAPPTLDCELGFQGLQTQARALANAQFSQYGGFDLVTQAAPDTWRVEIFFTTRWHPAYPAVAMRTLRKQVTGVWTAESKACGYGDQAQFAGLVEDMKASDKQLTDASRAEVERRKQSQSPLAPTP